MKKRGQIQSNVFMFVFILIIISLTLVFGYMYIKRLQDSQAQIEVENFKTKLKNDANSISAEYGSIIEKTYLLPAKYDKIIFADLKYKEDILESGSLDEYPLIKNSIENTDHNVYIISGNIIADSFNVDNLNMEKETPVITIPVRKGELKVKIHGKGDSFGILETAEEESVDEVCVPYCGGKECGDDGCGGICGSCSEDKYCSNGICISYCSGTDESCGITECVNCNEMDGCYESTYRDYYCSGTTCIYNEYIEDPRCEVCECDSGPCCDGCNFRAQTFVCDENYDIEYGCPWGMSCGKNVGKQTLQKYCSGISSSCDGATLGKGDWTIADECVDTEKCYVGECIFDETCKISECVPGETMPCNNADEGNCAGTKSCDSEGKWGSCITNACYSSFWDTWICNNEYCCHDIASEKKHHYATDCHHDCIDTVKCVNGEFAEIAQPCPANMCCDGCECVVCKPYEVWMAPIYVDNAGNPMSEDYLNLFYEEERWEDARGYVDVFQFYDLNFWYNYFSNKQVNDMVTKLNEWDINIALESGAVKDWGCTAEITYQVTANAINEIKRNGGKVKYISMDEPYYAGVQWCNLNRDQTLDQVVDYVNKIKKLDNTILVGSIEPYPAFTKEELKAWIVGFRQKAGYELPFFHIDVDRNRRDFKMKDVKELKEFCEDRGIDFGVIFIDNSWSATTDKEFYDSTMYWANSVISEMGKPKNIIIQTWSSKPDYNLPDNSGHSFTHLIRDFSITFGLI